MPQSQFCKHIVDKKSNKFCCYIACITVDETYLIWEWREFQKDYRYISLLCSYFSNIPIVDLFAIMTNNILNYIQAFLNLQSPVKLYKQFLDCLNITYGITKIKKLRIKEQDVFILSIWSLNTTSKTIISVDNINEAMPLMEDLRIKLLDNLENKENRIIQYFHSNLSNQSRKLIVEKFFWPNIRIWVCTKAANLGINILNILYMA